MTCSMAPTGEWVAWAGAGAHLKHVPHARDAGRVEAQRLVERIRVLPRVQREGIDEGAAGCQEAGGRLGGGLSDVQREPDW